MIFLGVAAPYGRRVSEGKQMTLAERPVASRTSLIRGRTPARDDQKAVEIIARLPRASAIGKALIVAVANERGEVYRRVELFCASEVVEFTARMNAIGFGRHPDARRIASSTYHAVLMRRGGAVPAAPGSSEMALMLGLPQGPFGNTGEAT